MRADRYLTLDIFLCRGVYEPKGICIKKTCKGRSLSVKSDGLSNRIKIYVNGVRIQGSFVSSLKNTAVDVYLTKEKNLTQQMTVYMLADGASPACMTLYPPCSDIEANDQSVDWEFDGEYVNAKLPLPDHCAVERFMTVYSDRTYRYDTPGHTGETDGESLSLTFDEGGFMTHSTSVDRNYLIPGAKVSVSYKLKGFKEYIPFAFIDFQTNVFTSGIFAGAGLLEKTKVYNNPARPEKGYTYETVIAAGGLGCLLEPEWIYDTRLRFAVDYRGEIFWLRSADFAGYRLGERVTIIKGADELPLTPSEDISSDDIAEALSETRDVIVSELFYSLR